MTETTVKPLQLTVKATDRKKTTVVIHMGTMYRKVYSYRLKKEDQHERTN